MLETEKVLLGIVMAARHLHEFHLTIKGHHLDSVGRCIFYLRNLLAGVSIDYSAWINSQRLNQLNLRLGGSKVNNETVPT